MNVKSQPLAKTWANDLIFPMHSNDALVALIGQGTWLSHPFNQIHEQEHGSKDVHCSLACNRENMKCFQSPSREIWLNKPCCIQTAEYYTVIKKMKAVCT